MIIRMNDHKLEINDDNDDDLYNYCDQIIPLFQETSLSSYKLIHHSKRIGLNKTIQISTRIINHVKIDITEQIENENLSKLNVITTTDIPVPTYKLFADNIWPGTYVLAGLLDQYPDLCKSKRILELGAGCALPSLVASILGADIVVITDYPDVTIIDNISKLVVLNKIENTKIIPYAWGSDVDELLNASNIRNPILIDNINHIVDIGKKLDIELMNDERQYLVNRYYDLILLAEVLWKDTYQVHDLLLQTITQCLDPINGMAILTLVHRCTLDHKETNDLEFLEVAHNRYGLNHFYVGCNNQYKDVLDVCNEVNAIVHMYILYFNTNHSIQDIKRLYFNNK